LHLRGISGGGRSRQRGRSGEFRWSRHVLLAASFDRLEFSEKFAVLLDEVFTQCRVLGRRGLRLDHGAIAFGRTLESLERGSVNLAGFRQTMASLETLQCVTGWLIEHPGALAGKELLSFQGVLHGVNRPLSGSQAVEQNSEDGRLQQRHSRHVPSLMRIRN
jgi:hypothetical protein